MAASPLVNVSARWVGITLNTASGTGVVTLVSPAGGSTVMETTDITVTSDDTVARVLKLIYNDGVNNFNYASLLVPAGVGFGGKSGVSLLKNIEQFAAALTPAFATGSLRVQLETAMAATKIMSICAHTKEYQ